MRLRFGSFEAMNDLREARQNVPGFSAHEDDAASLTDGSVALQIMQDMDWYLRRFVKIACFTRGFEPDPQSSDETELRGWAHPALWAHYGAAHSGVCLRFNRPRLIEALSDQLSSSGRSYAGNVLYPRDPLPVPSTIDAGQIKEFGLDAAVLDYMDQRRSDLLFTKNIDWAPEQEFRLLLIGAELAPAWLDISESLTGVYFGESFSPSRLDVAQELLRRHPGLETFKLSYFNRRFMTFPPEPGAQAPRVTARRAGALEDRLKAMAIARRDRLVARRAAEERMQPIVRTLSERAAQLRNELTARSSISFELHTSVNAIPPTRRQRAPGVPGEVIDFQTGLLIAAHVTLGEHTSHEYTASIGLSLLATGDVRADGLVTRRALQVWENWEGDIELWRGGPIESRFDLADAVVGELIDEVARNAVEQLEAFTSRLQTIAAAMSTAPTNAPVCAECGNSMEPVEKDGIVEWRCGYGEHGSNKQ
jgi:hypothetical protein